MERKRAASIAAIVLLVLGGAVLGAQAAGGEEGPGVLVTSVEKGSPAEKAVVVRGDIVLAVDGKEVSGANELMQAVAGKKAGDSVALKVRHGDAEKSLVVMVAERGGRPYVGLAFLPNPGPFGGLGNLPRLFQMPIHPGLQAPSGPGASVAKVLSGGPAEKAGLRAGDLIESVDGVKLDTNTALADVIGGKKPGDAVTLSVRSSGKEARDVKVTLEKNPGREGAAWLGVEYVMVEAAGRQTLPFGFHSIPGIRSGVIVNEVKAGSPAEKAGMKARDVIVKIEGVSVASPDDVVAAVTNHKPGDTVSFTVYRFNENKESELKAVLGENPDQKGAAWLGIAMGSYTGLERMPGGGSDQAAPSPMPRGPFHDRRTGPQGPVA